MYVVKVKANDIGNEWHEDIVLVNVDRVEYVTRALCEYYGDRSFSIHGCEKMVDGACRMVHTERTSVCEG